MLAGLWLIDSSLYPGTPSEIRSFISGFKWVVTIPLLVATVGGLVCLFIWFIIETSATKPTPRVHVANSIEPAERNEAERLRRIAEYETRKREEEERTREQERREARAAEERARFHKMKQTRSATEAAKASLEEF